MKNILVIAKWEVNRLVTRFGGRPGYIIIALVLLAIATTFLVYHSGLMQGKDLYRIGIPPGTPAINDARFQSVEVDVSQFEPLILQNKLDVYRYGDKIYYQDTDRSRFVKDTLLQYLAEQELLRKADEYGIDRAFPLRVQVNLVERDLPAVDTTGAGQTTVDSGTSQETPNAGQISGQQGTIEDTTVNVDTGAAVERQLNAFDEGGFSQLRETLLTERDVIIPSLTPPILPMAQVVLVFVFILPVLLVAVFFASSFAEERISRRIVVLLSTPVSPLQVILGKLLPYLVYSWIVIIVLTILAGSGILMNLSVFTPVILLLFSSYMIVALMYRSYKDLTLFSVLVISGLMIYLVVPALLTGVSGLSYISPLTLAVEIYRGEEIGVWQYFMATTPLYLLFFEALFIGTRIFNEEYLMSYKPLHRKIFDAISLSVSRVHRSISAFLSAFFLLPPVFISQLIIILFVQNISPPASVVILIVLAAFIEEVAKSLVPYIALKEGTEKSKLGILKLCAISGIGFFIVEKLFLFLSMSVLAETSYTTAVFNGGLLFAPLALHIITTSVTGIVLRWTGTRYYLVAVLTGTLIHVLYNLTVTGVIW